MNIGFRVDSSYKIGTGHVHRCLNLANEFKKKREKCYFFTKNFPGNLNNLIKKKFGVKNIPTNFNKRKNSFSKQNILDANYTIKLIKKFKIKLIFLDHYLMNYLWEKKVSKYCDLVSISDVLYRKTNCKFLINYNTLYEDTNDYKMISRNNCKRLIGPDYSIIKKYNSKKNKRVKKKIVVFMGGIDTKNISEKIAKILQNKTFRNYEILMIIGEKNIYKERIMKIIKKNKNFSFLIGNKKNLYKYLVNSSLVISNAGTFMYEHMSLGLNALVLPQSKLQQTICRKLSEAGLINYIKSLKKINHTKLKNFLKKKFSKKKELLNLYVQKGTARIVEFFKNYKKLNKLSLVKAKIKDKHFLYKLVNDHNTIENSINRKKIEFKVHEKWFSKKLKSKNVFIYILKNKILNLGQARVDMNSINKGTITYSISNEFRGQNLGYRLIKLLLLRVKKNITLFAKVRNNNQASKKIFEKCGFIIKKNSNNKYYNCYLKT